MGARLTQLKILVNSVLDGTGTLIGKNAVFNGKCFLRHGDIVGKSGRGKQGQAHERSKD